MGTIKVIEYASLGTEAKRDTDVADLSTLITTTVDATTSTTAESITLNSGTRLVRIEAAEDHRVSLGDSAVTSAYDTVAAGSKEDFGVTPGGTLYYRLNA